MWKTHRKLRLISVLVGIVVVACSDRERGVAPVSGFLTGSWEGLAFDYSDEPENPPSPIRFVIEHRDTVLLCDWEEPGWGLVAASWEADTVSMVWVVGEVRTEFRSYAVPNTDQLAGRWTVKHLMSSSRHEGAWFADRKGNTLY